MKKPAYQTRLEDSADAKDAMLDRANGVAQSDAPYPMKELRAARKDLRQGTMTPERARLHGQAFSQAMGKPRLEAEARAGAKSLERFEESLLKWALAMDGPDKASLRLAWAAGAEGAPDGARGLGLHGYWMAQALLRDDLQELEAFVACGCPLWMVRSEGRDAPALAFEWNARKCAQLVARECISHRLARLGIKEVNPDGSWSEPTLNGNTAMAWIIGKGRSLPFEIFRAVLPMTLRGSARDQILLRGSSGDFFSTLHGPSTDVPKPIWAMGALRRSFAASQLPGFEETPFEEIPFEEIPKLAPSVAMSAWRKISADKEAAWVESTQLEACMPTAPALSALGSQASPNCAKKGPRL